jgi:ABC-type transport system involved in multi-copper enzyme maturation permease subunit
MIFLTLIYGTLREAYAKKIILLIFLIISFLNLILLYFSNLDEVEGITQMMELLQEPSFKEAIIAFECSLIGHIPFLVVFSLLIMLVSSFIPSMLERGTIDLIISKPISRANIILAKFVAGNIFIFLVILYLMLPIWLMISMKSGIWHFQFLYSILWFTLIFSVLYSVLVNFILFFPITAILSAREELIFSFVKNKSVIFVFDFFYYLLPKPWSIRTICESTIKGFSIDSYQPLITSLLFMIAMLSVSILYFKKKDY